MSLSCFIFINTNKKFVENFCKIYFIHVMFYYLCLYEYNLQIDILKITR